MRWLLILLLAGCASEPLPVMSPPLDDGLVTLEEVQRETQGDESREWFYCWVYQRTQPEEFTDEANEFCDEVLSRSTWTSEQW